jgi:hypothetical protein
MGGGGQSPRLGISPRREQSPTLPQGKLFFRQHVAREKAAAGGGAGGGGEGGGRGVDSSPIPRLSDLLGEEAGDGDGAGGKRKGDVVRGGGPGEEGGGGCTVTAVRSLVMDGGDSNAKQGAGEGWLSVGGGGSGGGGGKGGGAILEIDRCPKMYMWMYMYMNLSMYMYKYGFVYMCMYMYT